MIRLRTVLLAMVLCTAVASYGARAGEKAIKVGVLTDMDGFAAETGGPGSVVAAQLAIDDFKSAINGKPIVLLSADMQDKPDVASSIARQWFDRDGVDIIADLPVSTVGLAVQGVARDRHKVLLITPSLTTELTGKQCSPWSIDFADDTSALSQGTVRAMVGQGFKSWFFITADFAFGHALEHDAIEVLKQAGGTVVGTIQNPVNTTDFASYIVAAQASKAQVVAVSDPSLDTINAIKEASEFGLTQGGQQLAALLMYISDIHSLGLKVAQGLSVTSGFYWDQNEQSRAFAKRFSDRAGRPPTKEQANIYAGLVAYFQAIKDIGSDDPDSVIANMRTRKIDYFGKQATLREDGRVMYDVTLYRVKKPEESKAPWDYYTKVADVPAQTAFLPLAGSACPYLKK